MSGSYSASSDSASDDQVSIGDGRVNVGVVPTYYEEDMSRYENPLRAVMREVMQNSLDAIDRMRKARRSGYGPYVHVRISEMSAPIEYGDKQAGAAGDLLCEFEDNGTGVTPHLMETILVSVGGTDKKNKGRGTTERGGFGAAKNLLFFAQQYYEVMSAHKSAPGDWYEMRGARNVHDEVAESVSGEHLPDHGTMVKIVLNRKLQENGWQKEPMVAPGPLDAHSLAVVWADEICRSSVPYVDFDVSANGKSVGRVSANVPHKDLHTKHPRGDWWLYKLHKRGDDPKSTMIVQVLGVHMFTKILDGVRSDFDIVLNIRRRSKRYLNQHRDALKHKAEQDVLRSIKNIDKSGGTVISFTPINAPDEELESWREKVRRAITFKKSGDRKASKRAVRQVAVEGRKAVGRKRGRSKRRSNHVKRVLRAITGDDLRELESIAADIDISYRVMSSYGRRRLPYEWLDAENLQTDMRILLRTIRMILRTIFNEAGKDFPSKFSVGALFTATPKEQKKMGSTDDIPSRDFLAEVFTDDRGHVTVFVNPEYDSAGNRGKGLVALRFDEAHAHENLIYLWGAMCHEAAHLAESEEDVFEHGADFVVERDRIHNLTTRKVAQMVEAHRVIMQQEYERDQTHPRPKDPHVYYRTCVSCKKIRRVPSKAVAETLKKDWRCDDNFWNLDMAYHEAPEERGLARAAASRGLEMPGGDKSAGRIMDPTAEIVVEESYGSGYSDESEGSASECSGSEDSGSTYSASPGYSS